MTERPAKRTSPRGRSAPATAPDAAPEPERITPDPVAVPAAPPPTEGKRGPVRRAGGHIDRGDGRGWQLDDEE